ncbi:MAG: hypothetical protein WC343_04785, partial [Bacilli bacterium]
MKYFWYSLLILGILVAAAFSYVQLLITRIDYTFRIERVILKDLSIEDLIKKGEVQFRLAVVLTIINDNSLPFVINKLRLTIYHRGKAICETTHPSGRVVIKPNNKTSFNNEIKCFLNSNTIDLLNQVKSGKIF